MKWTRPTLWALFVAVLGASSVATMYAQNTNSGDIRGSVTDTSGALIPGVTVKVEDVDKQVTRTFTTDEAGVYDTGAIVPDHYKITFSKPGFQTLVRGPITLVVGVQGIDASLQVAIVAG